MRTRLASGAARLLWIAVFIGLVRLGSVLSEGQGGATGLLFSLESAIAWLAGVTGLSFSSPRLLGAWRIASAALATWAAGLGLMGVSSWAWAVAAASTGSFAASHCPALRSLVAERIANRGEKRIPLKIPLLLVSFVLLPSCLLTSIAAGLPILLLAGARPSWLVMASAAIGVAVAFPLVISTDRLERRWVVIAPRGLVVHDPFLLASTFRIPPDAVEFVEVAEQNWRERLRDRATVMDLTAGCLSAPLLVRLSHDVEAPQPRHPARGGVFPPGGRVTLVALCPVQASKSFLALARAGYAAPGEYARLEALERNAG